MVMIQDDCALHICRAILCRLAMPTMILEASTLAYEECCMVQRAIQVDQGSFAARPSAGGSDFERRSP
jgi:hypothetical protein